MTKEKFQRVKQHRKCHCLRLLRGRITRNTWTRMEVLLGI